MRDKAFESFFKANWILLYKKEKNSRYNFQSCCSLSCADDDDNVSSLNMIWELFNTQGYNESHHASINLHESDINIQTEKNVCRLNECQNGNMPVSQKLN